MLEPTESTQEFDNALAQQVDLPDAAWEQINVGRCSVETSYVARDLHNGGTEAPVRSQPECVHKAYDDDAENC